MNNICICSKQKNIAKKRQKMAKNLRTNLSLFFLNSDFTPFLVESQLGFLRGWGEPYPKKISPILVHFLIPPDQEICLVGLSLPQRTRSFQQKLKLPSKSTICLKKFSFLGKFTLFLPNKRLTPKYFGRFWQNFFFPPGNMFSWVVFTPTNSIVSTKVKIAFTIDILPNKILIFGQIYDYLPHFCVTRA